MNWPSIFLGCFVIGFVLSALSFALRRRSTCTCTFRAETARPHRPGRMRGRTCTALGPINFATLTAFLAWFGGTGYLLTTQFRWLAIPALVAAVPVGLAGAAIVFWLMAQGAVVAAREHAERRLRDGRRARHASASRFAPAASAS